MHVYVYTYIFQIYKMYPNLSHKWLVEPCIQSFVISLLKSCIHKNTNTHAFIRKFFIFIDKKFGKLFLWQQQFYM